jgi:hypothetical protein
MWKKNEKNKQQKYNNIMLTKKVVLEVPIIE